MSARRTHDSFDFRLEALESRSLLSGIPTPNPTDVTLLNGHHPVADASFLDPNEDWSVAQGGHGSGGPPTNLNDDDMYNFDEGDADDASSGQFTDEELAQIDDVDGLDYSEVAGLPAGATQHLFPADEPIDEPAVASLESSNGVPAQTAPIAPIAQTPVVAATNLHIADDVAKASFADFDAPRHGIDSNAPLFTFGSNPGAGKFGSAFDSKKSSVIASFIDAASNDQPLSANLTLPPLV